jgi:hypothetical protein
VGILFAFFAGWATASKAGSQSHDEVVAALKAVRDSEEVADLVRAVTHHVGFALRELGTRMMEHGEGPVPTFPDVVARVRDLITPITQAPGAS